MNNNVIEIKGLTVKFPMKIGTLCAADQVDFQIEKGKITALVGESGSGKSTVASAVLRSVSSPGIISSGSIMYGEKDILKFNKNELQKYKWSSVAMVFQAAQNALNPVMTIKEQIIETVLAHEPNMKEAEIEEKAKKLFEYVRLDPNRVLKAFPHELSGGMKQRVMIAFSLLLDPELVILDEPTTALDVITQDYIFEILMKIHKELGITMLILTHDIGVVAKVADKVGVMYAGKIVESGDIFTVFENGRHPYTRNLIQAAPSLIGDVKDLQSVRGAAPNLLDLPNGCTFHPRCSCAKLICSQETPQVSILENEHVVMCHMYSEKNKKYWDDGGADNGK